MKCCICPDALYFPDIKSFTEFMTTNQTQQINGKDRLEIVMPDTVRPKLSLALRLTVINSNQI